MKTQTAAGFLHFRKTRTKTRTGMRKTHTGGCVKSRQAATGKTAKALARKRFRRSLTTSKNKPQQIVFSWQSCGQRFDPAYLHQNKKPFRKEWLQSVEKVQRKLGFFTRIW